MTTVNFSNLSFQQLEVLIAVVEEGTFSRAARRMHLSQPSLTKHIQHLEELAGTTLLWRGRKGVSLTPEGRLVFDYARKVVRMREETAQRLSRMIEGNGVEIVVGASTVPAVYILPRLIYQFQRAHPHALVTVISSDSEGVIEMVEEGELTIGFVGYRPSSHRLVNEALWPDHLILVASSESPYSMVEKMDPSELCELPFVIREQGSGTWGIVEKWLKEKVRLDPKHLRVVACLSSSEAVKEAVLSGVGVSFLSRRAVERELRIGLLKEIPLIGVEIKRDFYLIYRRSQPFLRYQELFLQFVRNKVGGDFVE